MAFPGFQQIYGQGGMQPVQVGTSFTRTIPKAQDGTTLSDNYIDGWMNWIFQGRATWKGWLFASDRSPNGVQYKMDGKMATLNVYLPGGTIHVTCKPGSSVNQEIFDLITPWTQPKS